MGVTWGTSGRGWLPGLPLPTASSGCSTAVDEGNTRAGDDANGDPISSSAPSSPMHRPPPTPPCSSGLRRWVITPLMEKTERGVFLLFLLFPDLYSTDTRLISLFFLATQCGDEAVLHVRAPHAEPRRHAEVGGVLRAAGVVVPESASAALARKRGGSASSGSAFGTTRSTRSARSAARMAKLTATDRDVNLNTNTNASGARTETSRRRAPRRRRGSRAPYRPRSPGACGVRAGDAPLVCAQLDAFPECVIRAEVPSLIMMRLTTHRRGTRSLRRPRARKRSPSAMRTTRTTRGSRSAWPLPASALDDLDALYARGPRRALGFWVNRYGVLCDEQEEAG
ncbi:hypothetical protein C8J57DRAFT_1726982 [Mycena rebaudengoi]|nr:hypothetical protein C8J57DRAFT_1726982 [Mycena rebaudengoi]